MASSIPQKQQKHQEHSILIVGGTGFIGRHLVSHFLADPTFSKVYVLSRSASPSTKTNNGNKSHLPGATYLTGDLTNYASIRTIIRETQPTLIVHAASPSPETGTARQYEKVNLHGTQNLLRSAKQSDHVRAFIYTSTSTHARGREHVNQDETCDLASYDADASLYARSKACADNMVLHANYPRYREDEAFEPTWAGRLSTASIRLPIVYGIGDHVVPACLNALVKGNTSSTVGDGKNLWSYCSVSNAARAHVLVARNLLVAPSIDLDPARRIAGQAFHINDGAPYPFWEFPRLCWKFAGYDVATDTPTTAAGTIASTSLSTSSTTTKATTHLPIWFVLSLAQLLEWIFWVGTLGYRRPGKVGKQQVEYMCFTHT